MSENSLLILVAHADDMEFMAGGTVAKLIRDGYKVHQVIATDNSRGSFELEPKQLITESEKEAVAAAKILGFAGVTFLGYSDGMLGDTPVNKLREQFIRLIRMHKPTAVMSWDYWALHENHPDHRAVAQAAMEALSFSHFPLFHPEHLKEGLKPHLAIDRYYIAKDDKLCDFVMDITDFVDIKIKALLAHESQMKLTVDELAVNLRYMGATEDMLKKLDRNNYAGLVEIMMKSYCSDIGKKAGYAFGEQFRFERAGGEIAETAFNMLR